MAIPIAYNFRNLVVRKTTTIMTALGIALTVAVMLAILAMLRGLQTSLESTGDPLQVLVLRKGANSELVSNFTREGFQVLKDKPGIAHDQSGNPMASLEMVTVINLVSVDAPDGMNVNVRGLEPIGIQMRKNLKLEAGRWFTPAGARWWWASPSSNAMPTPSWASSFTSAPATGRWWASCPPDRAPRTPKSSRISTSLARTKTAPRS